MRFSESPIWSDSRAYYRTAGTAAWTADGLPTRICNNAALAEAYASVIHHFLEEAGAGAERAYVVELGAATGRFAHLVLASLEALRGALGGAAPAPRSVLTDLAEATGAGWRDHPRLRERARAGELDRACFDVLDDQPLTLLDGGEALTRETTAAPVVVIANYVLDSLPCDVFRARDGRLEEGSPVLDRPLVASAGQQIAPLRFEYAPAASPPYDDARLAELCAGYAAAFTDTAFTVPVGAARCLRRLRALTAGPLLVLAADKGYVDEAELAPIKAPSVIQQRSAISMTVNFDALCKLVTAEGGHARHTTGRTASLQVAMLSMHVAREPARAAAAFHEGIERRGPVDAFPVLDAAAQGELTVDLALAVLRAAGADPDVFALLVPRLRPLLGDADPAQRRCLTGLLRRVLALSFPQPDAADVAFEAGVCLASVAEPREALAALAVSLADHGPSPHACFAMAMSHLMLGAPGTALGLLDQVLALDPAHAGAAEWRPRVAAELAGG